MSVTPPRILLVSTQPWVFPARLCMALRRAGFHTEGASPTYGYLGRSAAPVASHRLRPWHMKQDLERAIRKARPDRLVPCDDIATALVVQQHANPTARAIVAASLGDPAAYPVALSKNAQMALAAEIGVATPPTLHSLDRTTFDAAMTKEPFLQVLKVDGNFGGQGVAILSDPASAGAVWDKLTARPSLIGSIKCAVLERSVRAIVAWQSWQHAAPHLQAFVEGTLANRAVVCERGQVLAGISVVALQTTLDRGPTSVVRVVDDPGMTASTRAFVERLGLSGFHGFDFVLTPDGRALMLEMNPRATPICHLAGLGGHGLAAVLLSAMGRIAPTVTLPVPGETVALFPNELVRDPASLHLQGWHDLPCDDPLLLRSVRRDLAVTARLSDVRARLKRRFGRPQGAV